MVLGGRVAVCVGGACAGAVWGGLVGGVRDPGPPSEDHARFGPDPARDDSDALSDLDALSFYKCSRLYIYIYIYIYI